MSALSTRQVSVKESYLLLDTPLTLSLLWRLTRINQSNTGSSEVLHCSANWMTNFDQFRYKCQKTPFFCLLTAEEHAVQQKLRDFFFNLKRGHVFSNPQHFTLNKYVLLLAPLQSVKGMVRLLASGNIINV